jgi:hypothetical protein
MKKIYVICFCLIPAFLMAQNKRVGQDIKGVIYDNEKALELRMHTHGLWMVGVNIGKIKSYYKTAFYHVQLGELRSHKEISKSTDFANISQSVGFRSYSFGKQNHAFALRGGVGMKKYYSEKAAKNGVAVGLSYSGGVTAAMMKPYYLEVGTRNDAGFGTAIKYTPETAKNFLDPYKIRGKAGVLKGIGETQFIPGVHGQVGVHVDWGAFDEFLRAIEAGIMVDVFTKKLPIMVPRDGFDENRPFYLNLYVSLQFGKRN